MIIITVEVDKKELKDMIETWVCDLCLGMFHGGCKKCKYQKMLDKCKE